MIINSVGNYIETRDRLGYKHGYKDFLLEYKRRFKTPRPIPKHTVSEEVVKRAFIKMWDIGRYSRYLSRQCKEGKCQRGFEYMMRLYLHPDGEKLL